MAGYPIHATLLLEIASLLYRWMSDSMIFCIIALRCVWGEDYCISNSLMFMSSSSRQWPSLLTTTNTTTHGLAYFVKYFYFYMTRRWYCTYCSNNLWNTVWMPILLTPRSPKRCQLLLQQHHHHHHSVCGLLEYLMDSSLTLTSPLSPRPSSGQCPYKQLISLSFPPLVYASELFESTYSLRVRRGHSSFKDIISSWTEFPVIHFFCV